MAPSGAILRILHRTMAEAAAPGGPGAGILILAAATVAVREFSSGVNVVEVYATVSDKAGRR